ncbi:MAG: YbjQ family protein [Thermoplasmata archaeon]|nr:YbjQ family protein [Thermoplasmata archaeon]
MIFVNTETIAGKRIVEHMGIVQGATIRTKDLENKLTAFVKSLEGGEISNYTDMMYDTRKEAFERMVLEADKLGADGIVNIRMATASVVAGAAEIIYYGTAVKLE